MDKNFGQFGGQYVPEALMYPLKELVAAYEKYSNDDEFMDEFRYLLKDYVGRETPLYFAERLTNEIAVPRYT